ncbi:MAG: sulfotransferase [Promethearchaeota archaeon]
MIKTKIKKRNQVSIDFPIMGYAGWGITKFFDVFKSLSFLLNKLETITLRKDLEKIIIDRPIYITGLARAGTTIILEMLSKHPDLASHRYKHLLMPYLPHWFSQLVNKTTLYKKPFERVHKDGIFITRESPEAIEEMLWQKFFDNNHTETISNIISGNDSNPKFEKFYQNHIRKLMLNQNAVRYLTKNNYSITRLEYLLQLFPNSKILLIIRNPVNHIASLIKQTNLFIEMERLSPILGDWLKIIGHYEFGHHQVCINVNNTELIHNIRKLWSNEKTYVKGWAYYWSSIYDFIANQLDTNKNLKKATFIVRYEDLCKTPAKIIDKILDHTELSLKKFEKEKQYYIKHLHPPTYYTPDFSNQDLEYISEVTKATATRFGY